MIRIQLVSMHETATLYAGALQLQGAADQLCQSRAGNGLVTPPHVLLAAMHASMHSVGSATASASPMQLDHGPGGRTPGTMPENRDGRTPGEMAEAEEIARPKPSKRSRGTEEIARPKPSKRSRDASGIHDATFQ